MKKVSRVPIPNSLQQYAVIWTTELLNEIAAVGNYGKVAEKFKVKYKQIDVQAALEQMYFGKCCYCEQVIGAESYEHIEHLRPKSLPAFYQLTFEWNNLHWCCQKCNMAKGNKWDNLHPIVDPIVDNPLEYLLIDLITGEMIPRDGRGQTTVSHVELNREKLVKARKRTIRKLNELELLVKKTPSLKDDTQLIHLLNTYIEDEEEFSSLVAQYVDRISKAVV